MKPNLEIKTLDCCMIGMVDIISLIIDIISFMVSIIFNSQLKGFTKTSCKIYLKSLLKKMLLPEQERERVKDKE